MRKRMLGKTGIEVSEVALGGLFTSSLGQGVQETARIVERALELGINYIDTAPGYADSEQVLGQALRRLGPAAGKLVISTKLGGRPKPFDPKDKEALYRSFEESRRLLGREVIDILMIHEPDRPQLYDWWTNPASCEGPVMEVLERLKAEGTVRFTGLGGTTTAELAHFVGSGRFDVVLTAFNYNSLFREALHEVLPAASSRRMGIIIGSVYGQGGLGRRYDSTVRSKPIWLSKPRQEQLLAFYALLDELGMPITELGLRFVLSDPQVSCALIGPKSSGQLETSVQGAAEGPLPAEVLRRLDAIAGMIPFRPFEEPMILPFNRSYTGPGFPNLGGGIPVGKL
jgi:aryl-alcohol dehydrogenase-like predicted oxidoreductase